MKKRIPSALAILVMKIWKNIQFKYHKNLVKKSILIYYLQKKKEKETMFLSKISIHSCINHILHLRKKKHFWRFCLQSFRTEEILKCHIKDCLKINDKPKNEMH